MRDNKAEIKRFLDIKEANGQSSYTIRSQTDVLMKLYHFLESKPFREATEEDIVSFLSKMGKKHAPSTMKLIKMVVKSFYRHLYGMKKHEYPHQVRNINGGNSHERKIPIRPEHVLTKEDVAEVVRHCDNFRDKAIVTVLYETGARIGEFVRINIEHVKFDDKGAVLVIDGKTGSRRIRLIESVPFLQRWIESHPRRSEDKAPLWCSLIHKHSRLGIASIRHILTKLKKRSKTAKPLNPHAFRHSRLTELAKFLSDAKLKVFAGWSVNSTMSGVYVHLSGKDLDSDLFRIAGVGTQEEEPKESPLKSKECPRCGSLNDGVAEFCNLCGKPFNEAMIVEATLETQTMKAEIRELKEKSAVANDVIDSMWEMMDKLENDIKTLKAK